MSSEIRKEWENMCNNLKIDFRENQFQFHKRTKEFLEDNNDIQINKGGMGLGKTLAITKAIKDKNNNFGHFFISTPISQIKKEWAKELKKNNQDFAIWYAKSTHSLGKIKDPKFNTKYCNDDNKYHQELEKWEKNEGKIYTDICQSIGSEIDYNNFNIDNFYKKYPEYCFIPINRYHLETKNILIGDYFGFIFPSMYKKIVKRPTYNSCLIIDEAHMIPNRVSNTLSKSILLERIIEKIKEEIETDYFIVHRIKEYSKLDKGLEILEKIKDKLINKSKEIKDKEGRYTFEEFNNDWDFFASEKKLDWNLIDFRESLNQFVQIQKKDDEEDEDKSSCEKIVDFIDNWKEKYEDENYGEYFQYFNKKDEEIKLEVVCRNPAEYLNNLWRNWEKIIMLSGTIPDETYFKDMTGLNTFKVSNEDLLQSYNIKDDVIVYPKGNFTSKFRDETYEKNKPLLKDVLKNISGRTIIYVQSKSNSTFIEEQLKDSFKVYNFSKTEKGFLVDNNMLDKLKKEFVKEKNAVAITHITGKVEGQNYVDEEGNNISNIIIYGFPHPRRNKHYWDKFNHYKKLFGEKKARNYVSFFPPNTTIYQAVMRAKRQENHKPIILLWSKEFAEGSPGHKYSYDELKGKMIFDSSELINEVKKRENDRKTI